ncbi:hypothetical protein, partial [Capnocytophaga leadbetteri]|uniref:hypothetical protein n=1 Tax=Capnocytophaga leadbetteri TaxID=327575 RepID=UPI00288B372F
FIYIRGSKCYGCFHSQIFLRVNIEAKKSLLKKVMISKFSYSTLEGKYPLENVLFFNCWENVGKNHVSKKISP